MEYHITEDNVSFFKPLIICDTDWSQTVFKKVDLTRKHDHTHFFINKNE